MSHGSDAGLAGRLPGIDRDVSDRLSAARLWLVTTSSPTTCGNLPYLATALYSLIPVCTDRVREMAVDRLWRLYVNPTWIRATDIPVLAGRIAHLAWHVIAEHPERGLDLQVRHATAATWKQACDATIADVLPGMDDALQGASALGLRPGRSAEEYYAILSGLPAAPIEEGDGPPDAVREGGDVADASCGSGCDGLPRGYDLPPGSMVGAVGQGQADDIRRRVAIEFRAHHTGIGTLPGEWSRWVSAILEPVVPWTQVLAACVRRGVGWVHGHTDYTYSRISRRQAAAGPVILPATRRPVPEVAIIVDTSGSVDDGLLSQALGEVDGVLASLGVSGQSATVLATDAAVQHVTRVRDAADVRLGGGGGTNMTVGIQAALELRPRPNLIIVLTDGYTPWPEARPAIPVIAALVGRSAQDLPATPPWVERVECLP